MKRKQYYYIFAGTDEFVKEYCKRKIKTDESYMLKVSKNSLLGKLIKKFI